MRSSHTPGRPGRVPVDRWGDKSSARFFSHTADTVPAKLDPSLTSKHRGQFAATPWGMAGAVLQRVVSAEALAVLCQRARDFRRSTSAWAVGEAWRALVGTAMDPRAPSSRGKRQGVGDGWEARACDDGAHGLGTAEDTSLLGLLQTRVERGEGVIGKVQCEGAPEQGLHNKVLQKCTNRAPNIM